MWRLFCGLMAVDKGWSAYDEFYDGKKNPHRFVKSCVDLTEAIAFVCFMFGEVNWGMMFRGVPPKVKKK